MENVRRKGRGRIPGIPLIVPGERISEKIAEEMSEYEKMGFRIEGTKVKGKIEVLING